jgi:hypothetical protein
LVLRQDGFRPQPLYFQLTLANEILGIHLRFLNTYGCSEADWDGQPADSHGVEAPASTRVALAAEALVALAAQLCFQEVSLAQVGAQSWALAELRLD